MNKLLIALFMFCMFGFTGSAFAAKETLFHCGCNYDGTDLVWVELNVNEHSKGHQQHNDGDPEDCDDESGEFVDTYERAYDDCELAGSPDIDGVNDCFSVGVGYDFCYSDGVCFNVGDSCAD